MEDCKPSPSPFQSGVKLVATCTSPEVDATLYRQLVGSLLYLTHTILIFPLLLVLFPGICKHPMKSIGKKLKGYFGMFGVQFSLGYITVQGGLLYWLVSLIQIGSVTLMIESLLQVMFSSLVQDLSLGPVRNNMLFLFLQQKQSTKQWLMQVKKPCGFDRSFQSLDSKQQHLTTLWCDNQSAIKLSKDPVQHQHKNTSSYTCTSSEISFMIELLKCSFSLQKIKLQTFSQSLLQK
jgi:hypothetical protein